VAVVDVDLEPALVPVWVLHGHDFGLNFLFLLDDLFLLLLRHVHVPLHLLLRVYVGPPSLQQLHFTLLTLRVSPHTPAQLTLEPCEKFIARTPDYLLVHYFQVLFLLIYSFHLFKLPWSTANTFGSRSVPTLSFTSIRWKKLWRFKLTHFPQKSHAAYLYYHLEFPCQKKKMI
jgi:hypothetical protein